MPSKKFKEAGNTAVFTTKFVVIDKKDITHVYHYEEDGAWQFMSDDDFNSYEEVAKIVGLEEILKMDNTLLELADLPEGYYAHRKSNKDAWTIEELKN